MPPHAVNASRVSPRHPSGVTGAFVTFGARVNSEKCLSRQWGGEKPSPELCDWELCLGALRCGKPEPPFAEGSSDAAPMLLSATCPWGKAALAQGNCSPCLRKVGGVLGLLGTAMSSLGLHSSSSAGKGPVPSL